MNKLVLGLMVLGVVNGQQWYSYEGKEYYISSTIQYYTDAVTECTAMNANLATLKTSGIRNFIQETLTSIGGGVTYWIGLTRQIPNQDNSPFIWNDGTTLLDSQSNWDRDNGANEPNNAGGGENCAALKSWSSKWSDENCSKYNRFICQRNLPAPTTTTTTTTTTERPTTTMGQTEEFTTTMGQTEGSTTTVPPVATTCTTNLPLAISLATVATFLLMSILVHIHQYYKLKHSQSIPDDRIGNEDLYSNQREVVYETYKI